MKFLIWIGIIACFGLIAISAWLLWWNRSSETIWPKIIPVFVIGLIGIFFTIWFSTKSESIDLQFNYTLYFNKADKKLLDEHYSKQHAYGGAQFDITLRNFIDRKLTEKELNKINFNKDGDKVKDFYFDLVFIKLSSRFYWLYADWWDIYITSIRRGDGFETSVSANKPDPPCISLKWNDFLEALDSNDGLYGLLDDFSQKFWIKEMKAPPETKINIETSTYKKTLSMKNPFTEISITFNKHGGSVGLGDYQWLLGYNNKKNGEFWSEYFEVVCKAKFERLRSGHPEMPRYKKWVQTMFEEVRYQFDDQKRLIRARDYHELSNYRQLK